jgi:hypothetical protein
MDNLFENNGALFSDQRDYRYALWRIWDNTLPKVMFIGLNPSTANENENDPTIRRVVSFARSWGYGGVFMMNLFPFVTPYPDVLQLHSVLESDKNEVGLNSFSKKAERIVFAWGNFKEAQEMAKKVIEMFPDAYCLGVNKNRSPKHPLYIAGSTRPVKYSIYAP